MATPTKKPKQRSGAWFIAIRGSYLPVSWWGWLTYIPFIAYLTYSAVAAYKLTDSAAETILWTVPNWTAATVIMTWIARRTS